MKETTVLSSSGAYLQIYSYIPNRNIRGIIQINHGMVEHAGRYRRFAEACVDSGFGVFAHDIRGHGRTKAEGAPLGRFSEGKGLEVVLEDINFVIDILKNDFKNLPIISFGHSLGAMLALAYCIKYPKKVDALACWNKQEAGFLAKAGQVILFLEKSVRNPFLPSFFAKRLSFTSWNSKFKPNRTPNDWISRDYKEVDLYTADPLCGFDASLCMWIEVLRGYSITGKISSLKNLSPDLPIHLFCGQNDPSTNYGKHLKKFVQKLQVVGMKDVTYEVLESTRHETLNELNRAESTVKFISWLNKKFQ